MLILHSAHQCTENMWWYKMYTELTGGDISCGSCDDQLLSQLAVSEMMQWSELTIVLGNLPSIFFIYAESHIAMPIQDKHRVINNKPTS